VGRPFREAVLEGLLSRKNLKEKGEKTSQPKGNVRDCSFFFGVQKGEKEGMDRFLYRREKRL